MCKKLIYFISFIFVLGITLTSTANAADLNLVGWWKLDDEGATAIDSSGNDRHGTLMGDAHFVPGLLGGAIDLDGSGDYINIDGYKGICAIDGVQQEFTNAAWIKTNSDGEIITWGNNATLERLAFRVDTVLRVEHGGGNVRGTLGPDLIDNEWHHVAAVIPKGAAIMDVRLYVDGQNVTPPSTTTAAFNLTSNADVCIGCRADNTSRFFYGLIDDARIYDRALSDAQVEDLFNGIDPQWPKVAKPSPSDGAAYLDTWATLTWRPGTTAASHNVYFGENLDDVNKGAESTFVGNQATMDLIVGFPGFPCPGGLVPGTTYYWRVDEVEADGTTIHKGDVWSFWIPSVTAYDPVPTDGEVFEDPNLELSWSPGMNATMHAVYIGTDSAEVDNAVGAPPHIGTTFDPGLLNADIAYYWRVDTFNGAEWVEGPLWSFTTMPVIPVTDDPNLVVWWKFDEGAGTNATDASGHGNHGKLFGTQWAALGWIGESGLDFSQNLASYVAIKNMHYDSASGLTEVTVCAWIRTSSPDGQFIASFDRNEYWRLAIGPTNDPVTAGQVGWHVWTDEGQNDYGSATRVDDGQWHHVCGVFDNGRSIIYIDGKPELSSKLGSTFGRGRYIRYGFIGANSEAESFDGTNSGGPPVPELDDLRIYNKALSQDEILEAMRGDLLLAWDLQPPSGIFDVESVPSTLIWKPGEKASQHDVYFGTDQEAVNNADASDTTGVYRGRQGNTTYVPPEVFAWDQAYYWRIDEFNTDGTITKGGVRAIIVADFITIDDFEAYDVGNNEIWWAWKDGFGYASHPTEPPYAGNGTGSMVGDETTPSYTEETIVHGGRHAMPLFYDNNQQAKLRYSEVQMTLSPPRDWTKHNLDALSLWFHGDPCNIAEPIYVALNGSAAVTHENPDLALVEEWTEWNIKLQTFADRGVNLANVNTIGIGLGDRNNPQAGGSGTIYIDDIRLYQPRPVDPGTEGLVAYYTFENDTNDSSDNGLHGTLVGDPTYVEGLVGYGMALDFDGTDDLVELGKFDVVGQITLAAWIKADDFEINDARVISKANEWSGDSHWWMLSTISETSLRFRLKTDEGLATATLISDPVLEAGVWAHVVASWDDSMMRIYKDGVEVASQEKGGSAVAVDPAISVAIGSQPSDAFASDPIRVIKFFDGLIDEVRIYNRALSALEVPYLAGER